MGRLSRQDYWLKGSCWFHHVAKLRIVRKRTGTEAMRMVACNEPTKFGGREEWITIKDSHLKHVFVWIGRYLAKKGQLPRNYTLEEIAVGAQRTSKAIREVNAVEIFQQESRPRGGKGGKG